MDTICLTAEQLVQVSDLASILSRKEFRLFCVMLTSSNGQHILHLTQSRLASRAQCGVRSVRTYLGRFVRLGLIDRWRGPDGGNYYRIRTSLASSLSNECSKEEPKKVPEDKPIFPELQGTTDSGEEERLDMHPFEAIRLYEASRPRQSPIGRFLAAEGFLRPDGSVDREELAAYFVEHCISSDEDLAMLIGKFQSGTHPKRFPLIDIPWDIGGLPIRITERLRSTLRLYRIGFEWLEDNDVLPTVDDDGKQISEAQIRKRVGAFMENNHIASIEELEDRARLLHLGTMGIPLSVGNPMKPQTIDPRTVDLAVEQPSRVLMRLLVDDPEIDIVSLGRVDPRLLEHCEDKFAKDYEDVEPAFREMARDIVVKCLIVAANRYPASVAYRAAYNGRITC